MFSVRQQWPGKMGLPVILKECYFLPLRLAWAAALARIYGFC
jgi:hypothetical protein